MPTPAYSTADALYGQPFNLSAVLRDPATGNPKTGALSGLAAYLILDDGTQTAATNSPVVNGTTGWVSLDLTAAEMSHTKIDVEIRATGAMTACLSVAPRVLAVATDRYDALPVIRTEQLALDLHDFLYNRQNNVAALQEIYNALGFLKASGAIVRGDSSSSREKLQ